MDITQAVAGIAQTYHKLCDAVVDKAKWANKKDVELRGYQRREADYKNAHAGMKHFTIEEAMRKHQFAYEKRKTFIDKEVDKADALIKKLTEDLANLLVKHAPVGEIKGRPLIDMAKAEVIKDPTPTSTDKRFEKLETQLALFQETHKAQTSELRILKKENEELHAHHASYKAQSAELTAQLEQLQAKLGANILSGNEIQTLKQDMKKHGSHVSDLEAQLAAFVAQVKTQQTDFAESLEQAREIVPAIAAVPSDSASTQDFEALKQQVKELDKQLNNFDIKEYSEAMGKLLNYPPWDALDARVRRTEAHGLREDMQSRLQNIENTINTNEESYTGFSNKIVVKVGEWANYAKQQAAQTDSRMKALEDRVAAISEPMSVATAVSSQPASSNAAVNETRTAVQSATEASMENLHADCLRLRHDLNSIQNNIDSTLRAHTTAIESLDNQFKNLTTPELAHIILEHLRKLTPSSMVSPDLRNFHERLDILERFQRGQAKRDDSLQKRAMSLSEKLKVSSKRSLADDKISSPLEKRRKMEGLNERVNGAVHQ